jgi:uncharacterized protein YegJ (DUF2314 family)
MVKSAFKAGEQTEFMWIEVSRWVGAQISGLLMSEPPRYVTNLRAGQQLNVRESDFYDYLRVFADGKTEGNETGKILEARAGRR